MRNPFGIPRTLEQWVTTSLCWTLVCLGGWLGGSHIITSQPEKAELNIYWFPFGFCVATPLLTRYALLNGWRFVRSREADRPLWQHVLASCWFALLASFQLCCLAAFLFLCYLLFF